MKQNKHGQKVQNWHRPLAPRQLGRWFRRHRYDLAPGDDFWDAFDWCDVATHEHSWEGRFGQDEVQDLRWFELKQLLREILHRPPPLFRLEWAMDAALRSEEETGSTAGQAQAGTCLEQQLADFVHGITHFPNNPATRHRITEAIGDDVYLDVMRSMQRFDIGRNLVRNVCLFAPFWIRSPRTWTGGKASLVDHLFARYDVPSFI